MTKTMTCRGLIGAGAILVAATASAQSQPQTYQLKPEYFRVTDFKLRSGETLKEMVVEYATLGEPRRDSNGDIVNAVVKPHGWSGNYAQTITLAKDLVGPGKPLDPQKHFIIFPTSLGSPGSSAPSVSGLGPKFPVYAIADMVAAQHRLITEKFGIKKLAGVIGASMGGYQTLQWITQYPEMMNWAVPIAASRKADGRTLGIFGMISYNIRTDPAYRKGEYSEQPRDGLRRGFMGATLWLIGAAGLERRFKTEAQLLKMLEDAAFRNEKMDANDVIWRNEAMASYDVSADLPKVKARVLVVGVVEDELFPPELAIRPTADAIPGAKVFLYESPAGHVGSGVHIARANKAIAAHIAAAEGR